jgi:hypothetical protein
MNLRGRGRRLHGKRHAGRGIALYYRRLDHIEQRLDRMESRLDELGRALTTRERVIQGWAAIAREVGCSERHARKLARRLQDPLPCHKRRGAVLAVAGELRSWQSRQTLPHRAVASADAQGAGRQDKTAQR